MSGKAYDSERKDIERSFKRPSGWTKAFVGIAAALVLVIMGVMAMGVASGGQNPDSAAVPAVFQSQMTEDGASYEAAGTEVIADNETPMADGAEIMRASAVGGGMRILIIAGIAATAAVFGWLMYRENRNISIMRRRIPLGAQLSAEASGDSEGRLRSE